MLTNGGMSIPRVAAHIRCTCARSLSHSISSRAAVLFLPKDQRPQSVGTEGGEPALLARGDRMVPDLLAHARIVAQRRRPGGRGVEDQRRSGRRSGRDCSTRCRSSSTSRGRNFTSRLAVLEHLPHHVGMHGDIALGIDQFGAVGRGTAHRQKSTRVAGRWTAPSANGMPCLVGTASAAVGMRIPRPGYRRTACLAIHRIHRQQVEAGLLGVAR